MTYDEWEKTQAREFSPVSPEAYHARSAWNAARATPLDLLLFCPRCSQQHVDAPDPAKGWTNPPHATHTCAHCGLLWRPSNALTNGVRSLPALEDKHVERILASDARVHRAYRKTPLKLTGGFVRYCGICQLALDRVDDPSSRDCGGDCLKCMAVVGEDPDCIAELAKLRREGKVK